jgi:uncharacterized protein (TIGR00730 family)
MQRVCVFCGSQSGTNPIYADAARKLGLLLAQRGCGLVFGGGRVGLMGVLALAALEAGGEVIGVIPHALSGKEIALEECTELVVVESMHQRKQIMADRSDTFVALPGAYGTCDELFEILTWAQLGIHGKPVALLNTVGFFDPLLVWADHMVVEGFLKPKYRGLVLVANEPEELLDLLERSPPRPVSEKWVRPAER